MNIVPNTSTMLSSQCLVGAGLWPCQSIPVTRTHAMAVVVAAYFTSLQRAAVRQAVEATGLTVVQLLSEPVAAAMAYGLFVAGKKQVSTARVLGAALSPQSSCHQRGP